MGRSTRKRDNSGITLLEVIIAVSIFSIAAVVLLQGFVTSGKINKKSNLYLEATSTAQNIMEEIKAKDFEDVALAFNYPKDPATGEIRFSFLKGLKNIDVDICELYREEDNTYTRTKSEGEMGEPHSSTILLQDTEDKGKVYTFNPREKGENASKYFFQMNNIKNNHETFDALIEFDGSKGSDYKGTETDKKKNDQEIPNIAKLDHKENVFLIMPEDKQGEEAGDNLEYTEIEDLIEYLYGKACEVWRDKDSRYDPETSPEEDNPGPEPLRTEWKHDEISASAERTIVINIMESGASIKYNYTMDFTQYVENDSHDYGDKDQLELGQIRREREGSLGGKKGLKGIYLFYYPNYNSRTTKVLDNIIVNNQENTKMNFYLVKEQASKEVLQRKKIDFKSAEKKYRMNLEIHENPEELNKDKIAGAIKLRTNLNYNLADEILERREMSLFEWQMQFSYYWKENMEPIKVPYESKNRIQKLVDYSGLDNKEVKDRIYKVKVTVYKHVEKDQQSFLEENKVVMLDGSKED